MTRVPDHECVKDASFKEMTGEFKTLTERVGGLCTDIALVKRDVSDLKQVTVTMSHCIEALTASSIKAGENNITRDQFYGKIDELVSTRRQLIDVLNEKIEKLEDVNDQEHDGLKTSIAANKVVCDDYISMKKVIWGVVAALVVFLLIEGYKVLMHTP